MTAQLLHEPLLPPPGSSEGEGPNAVRRAPSSASERFGFELGDVGEGDEVIRKFQLQVNDSKLDRGFAARTRMRVR